MLNAQKMRNFKYIIAFYIIILPILGISQVSDIAEYGNRLTDLKSEKVYVHTDRNKYTVKDELWLKIYLLDGKLHTPLKGPGNVYIDLVNSKGEALLHKVFLVEDGYGHGNFQIPAEFETGTYSLNAYTAYMKSFGGEYFFSKELSIAKIVMDENRRAQAVIADEIKTVNKHIQIKPSLQFMPEGGYLTSNIKNNLAFKILKPDGKGLNINGVIKDQFGNLVDSLKCDHLGMGSLDFVPYENIKYYAQLNGFKNDTFLIPAPCRLPQLKYMGIKDSIVTIKVNNIDTRLVGKQYFLAIKSKGVAPIMVSVTLKRGSVSLKIPQIDLISGLGQVVLLDQNLDPLTGRLIFIPGIPKASLKLEVSKSKIERRAKTSVTLQLENKSDIQSGGNLSLAAVNLDQIGAYEATSENIISYLELSSEIKGDIENPAFYFANPYEKVKREIDLLLLTQGWRNYIWDEATIDSINGLEYTREYGLTIEGKAKRLILNKALIEGEITMLIPDYSLYMEVKTDSNGAFSFDHFVLHDSTKVVVAGKSKKGKKNVEIIGFDYVIPAAPEIHEKRVASSNTESDYINKALARFINDSYLNFDESTILIDEVDVVDKRKLVNEDLTVEGGFGFAEDVIRPDENDYNYVDMLDYLQVKISGLMVNGDQVRLRSRGEVGMPVFLLNGMEVDAYYIQNLPVEQVDNIKVNKSEKNASMFADSVKALGYIAIYTKEGYEWNNPEISFDILGKVVEGFVKPKIFYAPDYEGEQKGQGTPDLRATIYWEPNIVLDNDGKYKLSYFNSDDVGKVAVIIQGMLNNGRPAYSEIHYQVN